MTSHLPSESEPEAGLSRSRVLVVMGSYFLLTGVLQAFVPLRATNLGTDGAAIGILLVLTGGGIGLFTDLGFAAYADAYGRDKVVFAGFACVLVAVCLVVVDSSITALFVGCFLVGLGSSAIFDPLLALLTTTKHNRSQAITQGFNVTIQRAGALLAVATIGLTLASRHDEILVVAGGAACLAAMVVMYAARRRSGRYSMAPVRRLESGGLKRLLKNGYRDGLKMFLRRRIVMAAIVSVAVNLIFIETNAFVPLLDTRHGLREAVVVTAALGARDLVAIAVGVFTVATGKDASSSKVVVAVLCLAAVSAAGIGLGRGGPHAMLILWCALQGVAIGVGVAAMNLLTVGASSEERRSLAMAAATLINRLGVIVIPVGLGLTLQLAGLKFVFFVIAGTLVVFGLAFFGAGLRAEEQ